MIISIYRVNNPQLVIHHHPYKYLINLYLVGGIPTPLKNMFVRQLG